ncbi:hypothetical protein LXL04_004121 [Taraxacum kok-saghyz]
MDFLSASFLLTKRRTKAVKEIKTFANVMPPLKITSSTDKRMLQSDVIEDYWGAILLVEDSYSFRSICGYKSFTFKVSEQHYHSTFKEILAVKRGIEKLQFYLIGHEFQVEMDMASFPRMLQFKRKMLPEAQLLRWANWPRDYKSMVTPSPSSKPIKMVLDIEGDSSSSSTEPPLSRTTFPTIEEQIANLPNNIKEAIADITLPKQASLSYKLFLTILLQKDGPSRNLFTLLEWFLHGHTWAHQLSMVQKKYVVIMFRRPVTYHDPESPHQNQPQLYHAPLSFIHEWSHINPTYDLCILKNSNMYFRLRYCLAYANRVDPATIPIDIMHELISWSDNDPISCHWIQALGEWKSVRSLFMV